MGDGPDGEEQAVAGFGRQVPTAALGVISSLAQLHSHCPLPAPSIL